MREHHHIAQGQEGQRCLLGKFRGCHGIPYEKRVFDVGAHLGNTRPARKKFSTSKKISLGLTIADSTKTCFLNEKATT
jgi:hypothetical protein